MKAKPGLFEHQHQAGVALWLPPLHPAIISNNKNANNVTTLELRRQLPQQDFSDEISICSTFTADGAINCKELTQPWEHPRHEQEEYGQSLPQLSEYQTKLQPTAQRRQPPQHQQVAIEEHKHVQQQEIQAPEVAKTSIDEAAAVSSTSTGTHHSNANTTKKKKKNINDSVASVPVDAIHLSSVSQNSITSTRSSNNEHQVNSRRTNLTNCTKRTSDKNSKRWCTWKIPHRAVQPSVHFDLTLNVYYDAHSVPQQQSQEHDKACARSYECKGAVVYDDDDVGAPVDSYDASSRWYSGEDYKRFKHNVIKAVKSVLKAQERRAQDPTREPFSYSALLEQLYDTCFAMELESVVYLNGRHNSSFQGSNRINTYNSILTWEEQQTFSQRLYRSSLDCECVLGLERLLVPKIGKDRSDLRKTLMHTLQDLQQHYQQCYYDNPQHEDDTCNAFGGGAGADGFSRKRVNKTCSNDVCNENDNHDPQPLFQREQRQRKQQQLLEEQQQPLEEQLQQQHNHWNVLAENMCQISLEVSRPSRLFARYLAESIHQSSDNTSSTCISVCSSTCSSSQGSCSSLSTPSHSKRRSRHPSSPVTKSLSAGVSVSSLDLTTRTTTRPTRTTRTTTSPMPSTT